MPTPKFDALIEASPEMMSELMKEFVDGKDYNARAKIRMKMKILLDLASVDTKYPDIPALQHGRGAVPGLPGLPGQGLYDGYANALPMALQERAGRAVLNRPDDGIEPIPGANPERENEDILEAPGGNVVAAAAPAVVNQNF